MINRMSGRHPFSELTRDFTPERRRRVDDMKRELLAEMPLHELRRAWALSQRSPLRNPRVVARKTPHPIPFPQERDNGRLQIGGRRALYKDLPIGHIVNATTKDCKQD